MVAVGGGGLFAGVAVAAHEHGIRVVAVEPEGSRALHTGLAAGAPVDVPVQSVAADSLGARRVTPMALEWAERAGAVSVLVPDEAITATRAALWDRRRLAVEHAAATALTALSTGAYVPAAGRRSVSCCAGPTPGWVISQPRDGGGRGRSGPRYAGRDSWYVFRDSPSGGAIP